MSSLSNIKGDGFLRNSEHETRATNVYSVNQFGVEYQLKLCDERIKCRGDYQYERYPVMSMKAAMNMTQIVNSDHQNMVRSIRDNVSRNPLLGLTTFRFKISGKLECSLASLAALVMAPN